MNRTDEKDHWVKAKDYNNKHLNLHLTYDDLVKVLKNQLGDDVLGFEFQPSGNVFSHPWPKDPYLYVTVYKKENVDEDS